MDMWGTMARGAVGRIVAAILLLTTPAMAAGSPAELISGFRMKNGEVRVIRDATLDRIALEQARAMAAKDNLSHEVLGPFNRRVAPAGAGGGAGEIAHGYEGFWEKLGEGVGPPRAPQKPPFYNTPPPRGARPQGGR